MFGDREKIAIERAQEGHLGVGNNLFLNMGDSYIDIYFCDYSFSYTYSHYVKTFAYSGT